MSAVDLRAVRSSHGPARRVHPAPSAVRPSVLSVAQRPNASLCNKRDRRFAPQKRSVTLTHTIERVSRFLSSPCALLPRSFRKERKSTPLFSIACARFCGNGGCAVLQKINYSRSVICKLRKEPITQESAGKTLTNRPAEPKPTGQPGMRQHRLCVIVSGRPHVVARRVSRILKTKSEVHLL